MVEVCAPDEQQAAQLASDPRWQLVERILATPAFQRSPRLSEFLHHVCRLTLEGRSEAISEQYLAEALFGRAPGYDSSSDTIVRSHALRLRRRLEEYFRREGRSESLQLIIPRGGYVPQFVSELAPEGDLPLPPAPSPLVSHPLHAGPLLATEQATPLAAVLVRYRTILTLALCFMGLLVLTVFYQWRALAQLHAQQYHDRNHPLWGRLFNAKEPTRIILGDSGLVLFHAAARRYVSLHDYVSNDLSSQLQYVQHVEPSFALLLASRRYTSWADATTAVRLLRLPEARPDRTTVSFARDVQIDDFKTGNLVMIGAQEADPWVELFERQMDFVFSIDTPDKHQVVQNRNPRPGEARVYSPQPDGPSQVYAVIALLPNLTDTGDVLLLEGTNMAGTEAAVDLVLDDRRLQPLLQPIRRPDGSLPRFEMLISTNVVKDSPAPPQMVALHTHR